MMLEFDKNPAGKCAKEIITWLLKKEQWCDVFVYCNGKRYGCKDAAGKYHYENTWDCVFVEEDVDPKQYIEYGGDFLTMSFDGGSILYEVFNYYLPNSLCDKYIQEFEKIISKYKKFYELGYAWSLSLYDN